MVLGIEPTMVGTAEAIERSSSIMVMSPGSRAVGHLVAGDLALVSFLDQPDKLAR